MNEYVSPAVVKLTGSDDLIDDYGFVLVTVIMIGLVWAWY